MTPEQLRIPEMHAPRYHRKVLSEREILCFAAVMETTDKSAVPHLLPLIGAFGRMVIAKQQIRTGQGDYILD